MIALVKQWFAPPIFEGDEEKTRLANLLNAGATTALLFLFLVILGNLLGGNTPASILLIDIFALIIGLLLRHWLRRGEVKIAGIWMLIFGFISITGANASLGTIRTPSTTTYLLLVVIAGMLFGLRGILSATIASSLAVLGLILAENAGLLPQPDYSVTITQWITYTILFGLTGGLVSFALHTMRKALAHAEKEIEEREQAEEKLHQQNEYLFSLHQITLDLLSRRETQALLNNIAQYAMSLVNAQHGYIFLPDGDSLVLRAATENFAHTIGKREPKPGTGVLGHVWQSMGAFVVENYSEWEFRDPNYQSENLRAIAGVPIKIGNNIIGVLEVANTKTPRAFTNEELQILDRFATLAALVLDNAQILDSTEHEVSEHKRNEAILQRQMSQVEQFHAELREQAIRDPLTGLYNRRYMQDVFEQEFSRARRENYPISVIMLDMDELKLVNDTHGHHIGDLAIQILASHLESMVRKEDIVCRYGGDEFTIILSKTLPKDAAKRVKEWRESLNKHPLKIEGGSNVPIKFTAGVASYPTHGTSIEEIINYADVALYRAKAQGRNCTVVFE